MADFGTDFNIQSYEIESIFLADQIAPDLIYLGTSKNGRETGKSNWRIKKVWLDGTIWRSEFPNGDQSYAFVWDNRAGYTYL